MVRGWWWRGIILSIVALVFLGGSAAADEPCPLLDIYHSRTIRGGSSYQILKPSAVAYDLAKIRADLEKIALAGLINWRLNVLGGPIHPEYRQVFRDGKWDYLHGIFPEVIPQSMWPLLLELDSQAKRAMPKEFPYSVSRISIRWIPEGKSGQRNDWHQDGFVYVVVITLEGPTTLVADMGTKTHFSAPVGVPALLTGNRHPDPPEEPTRHKTPEFDGRPRIFIQMGYDLRRTSHRQTDFMDKLRRDLGL